MTILEKLGLSAAALIVAFCIGVLTGTHNEAMKWQAAVNAEAAKERDAIVRAKNAETALAKVTATSDATADELENAREALLAKDPVSPVCSDSVDDVGSLRRLIEPR